MGDDGIIPYLPDPESSAARIFSRMLKEMKFLIVLPSDSHLHLGITDTFSRRGTECSTLRETDMFSMLLVSQEGQYIFFSSIVLFAIYNFNSTRIIFLLELLSLELL